ncbi:hypothetical protein GTQ43_17975 [Nostoc sp. KVJ3]|uniref:hypothetical protein n=1 Tax=Nostoc sp. KVJ3 TaxID=457945 RepID=UPI0022389346|nr:hypothetical protein [Nostoc sp. KVJ3]MCW5315630.1 hypothetical protein [Nostoc sp. KVJ3]
MNANTLRIIQLALSLIGEGFQVLGQTKVVSSNTANTVAGITSILLQAIQQPAQPQQQSPVNVPHTLVEGNDHAI